MGTDNLHTLLFADDQVILAEDGEDVEYMVRKLIEEYDKWGLDVNLQKTKYMVIGREGQDIVTAKGVINHVTEYEYLGVTLTSDGTDDRDILNKMGKGRAITRQLHSVLWNKNISFRIKTQLFKAFVESCATYGSEVWTVSPRSAQRVTAMEMNFWRRCCQKTLLDHVRNEDVRDLVQVERTLTDRIEENQLLWFGHMNRLPPDRLPAKAYVYVPNRRRKRGRPRRKWKDNIEVGMRRRGLREEDCLDKTRWRQGCGMRL